MCITNTDKEGSNCRRDYGLPRNHQKASAQLEIGLACYFIRMLWTDGQLSGVHPHTGAGNLKIKPMHVTGAGGHSPRALLFCSLSRRVRALEDEPPCCGSRSLLLTHPPLRPTPLSIAFGGVPRTRTRRIAYLPRATPSTSPRNRRQG